MRSQKAQGTYHNTTNSLTGASASSVGAIHYATVMPPSNPMPMARPRAHGLMKVIRKSTYAPGVFKAHLRSVALGRMKRGSSRKKGHKSTLCVATGTRQGQRSTREQPTAPGRTESVKACGLSDMGQLHDELVQGNCIFKWGQGTGNV